MYWSIEYDKTKTTKQSHITVTTLHQLTSALIASIHYIEDWIDHRSNSFEMGMKILKMALLIGKNDNDYIMRILKLRRDVTRYLMAFPFQLINNQFKFITDCIQNGETVSEFIQYSDSKIISQFIKLPTLVNPWKICKWNDNQIEFKLVKHLQLNMDNNPVYIYNPNSLTINGLKFKKGNIFKFILNNN